MRLHFWARKRVLSWCQKGGVLFWCITVKYEKLIHPYYKQLVFGCPFHSANLRRYSTVSIGFLTNQHETTMYRDKRHRLKHVNIFGSELKCTKAQKLLFRRDIDNETVSCLVHISLCSCVDFGSAMNWGSSRKSSVFRFLIWKRCRNRAHGRLRNVFFVGSSWLVLVNAGF